MSSHLKQWKIVLLHAVPICLLVLGLFYFWFVVADRYVIFLYNHLGATPFDKVTQSRYWMTGLVASGVVMALYTISNWFFGRIAGLHFRQYHPPAWWCIWLAAAPILLVGIPLITMTQNHPRMPFLIAAQCTAVTLVGLTFALAPGSLAAQQSSELFWYICYGIGLLPELLLLRALELPSRGLITTSKADFLAFGGILISCMWLGVLSWLRTHSQKPLINGQTILIAGLSLSYVVLPLVHYLFFVPPRYRYISTGANFFALDLRIQLFSIGLATLSAMGAARLQRSLQRFLTPATI